MKKEVKKEVKPDCYTCKHRGEVPGSAHSCCEHPEAKGNSDPLEKLMSIFASVGRCAPVLSPDGLVNLNIKANMHGVTHGWFNWPYNFDPIWLEACSGWTKK